MLDRPGNLFPQSAMQAATAALLMWTIAAGAAWPQGASPPSSLGIQAPAEQAVPPQSAPAPPQPAQPAREENPGLFDEIGKMFDRLPTLKGPQETLENFNTRARDAAKDASDSLSRLAKPSSMVAGRTICPVSANGASDCQLGADKLCQAKGFKEGKSLIPGRARKPDDCRTDHYVTSALCQ
jgi:hypothetical protein